MSSSAAQGRVATLLLVVALAGTLTACQGDKDATDPKDLASAECVVPVSDVLRLGSRLGQVKPFAVTSLGSGRYRVGGIVLHDPADPDGPAADYTCDVAPDRSNRLRGFRVTQLRINGRVVRWPRGAGERDR